MIEERSAGTELEEAQSADSADTAVAVTDPDDLDLGYRIQLEAFSGPLDLLLYLVRRSEVDINEIKIEDIADQFLATLQSWDELNLDVAGDFILMAASLLEIKARMTVPPDEDADDEEEDLIDPRAELIQQLLQFKKFKEATQVLQDLEDSNLLVHQRRHHEQIPESDEQEQFNLENADPYQLFVMWDNMLVSIAGKRPRSIVFDDIPIEQRVKQVMQTMQQAVEGQLDWLLASVNTRIQRIGVFVAVLECVRKAYLEAIQHEQYGAVYLRYKDDEERAARPMLPPEMDVPIDGKRRRRRRQLVTFQQSEEDLASEDLEEDVTEEEVSLETDEQRFLRELNEETAVDALLSISKDLDASIQRHLYDQGVIEEVQMDDEHAEDDIGAAERGEHAESAADPAAREEVDFEEIAGGNDDDESDDDDDDCESDDFDDDIDDDDEFDDDEYDDEEDEYDDDDDEEDEYDDDDDDDND